MNAPPACYRCGLPGVGSFTVPYVATTPGGAPALDDKKEPIQHVRVLAYCEAHKPEGT